MSGIAVRTEKRVAFDSPDHIQPHGTANDNSANLRFNRKLARLLGQSLRLLDLGCAGGGLVRSVLDGGGFAVGIEGSDFSQKAGRAEWATIPGHLFTADITVPFRVVEPRGEEDAPLLFNAVTAWEVMEHIREDSLPAVAANILAHLAPGGVVVMSISPREEVINGVRLHQTVRPPSWWIATFGRLGFEHHRGATPYFGRDWVRWEANASESFHLVLTRAGQGGRVRRRLARLLPGAVLSRAAEAWGESARRLAPALVRRAYRRLRPRPYRWTTPELFAISDVVRPGDVVFDVGANLGLYAVELSRLVGPGGRVHAFEANPELISSLGQTLARERIANCHVVNAAVCDSAGEVELHLDTRPRMAAVASTIVSGLANEARLGTAGRTVPVRSIRLDDYCERCEEWPDVVKLDVEGAELIALRGFRRGLARTRPHLVLEYAVLEFARSAESAQESLRLLEAEGYHLFDCELLESVTAAHYADRFVYANVLAIHRSRLQSTPYAGLEKSVLLSLSADDLEHRDEVGETLGPCGRALPPGRYLASYRFDAEDDPELEIALLNGQGSVFASSRGRANSVFFSRHLLFEIVGRTAPVRFSLRRHSGHGSVDFDSVTLSRLSFRG